MTPNQLDPHAVDFISSQLRLRIIRPLGSGAFKTAYLASKDGHYLALKIAVASGGLEDRLIRESHALSICNHPAIARIIDHTSIAYNHMKYHVILEEYLQYGTLADKKNLTKSEIKAIGLSLASAIQTLCKLDIVHRDIKPANILFREVNEPVLTDFGLVRLLNFTSLTQDFMNQGPGTPVYAAPEQLLNEKNLIDWRTDQFCLALVISELLLNHHAFNDSLQQSPHEAISRVMKREPLSEFTSNKLISLGFGCLTKALAPWPIGRYKNPDSFINALQGVC